MSTSSMTPVGVNTDGPQPTAPTSTGPATMAIQQQSWTPAGGTSDANALGAAGCVVPSEVLQSSYQLQAGQPYSFSVLPASQAENGTVVSFAMEGFAFTSPSGPELRNNAPIATYNGIPVEDRLLKWQPDGVAAHCALFELVLQHPHDEGAPDDSQGILDLRLPREDFASLSFLVTTAKIEFQSGTAGSPNDPVLTETGGQSSAASPTPSSTATSASGSGSSGPKASVIVPAVLVPILVILAAAVAGFFIWRRKRRTRMAPSAAFRADHPDAMVNRERAGGGISLGAASMSAGSSSHTQQQPYSYFPLDEKRPLNEA